MNAAADGLTVDTEGYLYVATREGVHFYDQPGSVTAIIGKPQASALPNVVFGGPNLDTLDVTAGHKVFRRVRRRHGVSPWQTMAPPKPRL